MSANVWDDLAGWIRDGSASDQAASAAWCVVRWAAIPERFGVGVPAGGLFPAGEVMSALEGPDAVVAAVAARRPLFADFVEALEAGEPDEESDRYFLLSGFAEMVLRADSAQDRAGIRQWADFCAFRSLDLACHLDSLGVTGDSPAGDADAVGASVGRAEGVELAAQAGIWRLAADDGPSDRAAEISAAARRLISAALANVADDG